MRCVFVSCVSAVVWCKLGDKNNTSIAVLVSQQKQTGFVLSYKGYCEHPVL